MAQFTEDDLCKVLKYVGAFNFLGEEYAPDAEVLRELGLFEMIRNGLVKEGLTPDDLKGDLDDIETKLNAIFADSVMGTAEVGRSPENNVVPAFSTLSSIAALSKHLLYSAKAESMQARWAKDYYNGYYSKRKTEINNALSRGETAGGGGYNNEGGASYYRIVDTCASIGHSWTRLPEEIDEAASKEGIAQLLYDAYDKALDEYWALLGKFEVGLSQEDVAYWVGAIFRTMLTTHRKNFRACNPKVLATIKPLGEEKVKKVEGWIAKTEEKFAAALKAAGA